MILGLGVQLVVLACALQDLWVLQTWIPVKAEMIRSSVDESKVIIAAKRGGEQEIGAQRSLTIRYRYELGGKTYESERYGVGPLSEFVGTLFYDENSWVRDHPVAHGITVYANPSHSENAAIDPRPNLVCASIMLLTGLLTGFAAYFSVTEEWQTRLAPWRLGTVWGLIVLLVMSSGRSLGIGAEIALSLYFLTQVATHRWARLEALNASEPSVSLQRSAFDEL